jgi:DNA-binding NarL/FixJ family response regulator
MTGARVLVADPRRLVREAIARSLSGRVEVESIAAADDLASAVLQAERLTPDVVVVTERMLGPLPQLSARLRAVDPRPRTLVIDAGANVDELLHALEAGADGYLTAESGIDDIVAAVHALARGESVVPPSLLGPLLRALIQRRRQTTLVATRLERLTPREREVLALVTDGLSDADIATRLVISPQTARTHVQRILRKLEVHSRLDAITLVTRLDAGEPLERLLEGSPT